MQAPDSTHISRKRAVVLDKVQRNPAQSQGSLVVHLGKEASMVAVLCRRKKLDVGNIKGFDVHAGRIYAKYGA